MADVRVIAINPPSEVKESERVGLVRIGEKIPLADNSVDGVALDAWFPESVANAAIRVLKAGGRIVGPESMTHPADATVLAHDDKYWVAEKPVEMISITRPKSAT
jgi:tRNA A58 N-methylase Trm61